MFAQWIVFEDFGMNLCPVSKEDSFEYICVALSIAACKKQDRASGFCDLFMQFNDYVLMFSVNMKLITLISYIY